MQHHWRLARTARGLRCARLAGIPLLTAIYWHAWHAPAVCPQTPLLGHWSDLHGRKPFILVSQVGLACLGFESV